MAQLVDPNFKLRFGEHAEQVGAVSSEPAACPGSVL